MKNIFRKFVVSALSSLVILQACQTPNVNNTDNKSIINKNEKTFNTKSNYCDGVYKVELYDIDDDMYVTVNGTYSFSHPYSRELTTTDISQYIVNGTNNIDFYLSDIGGGHSYGVNVTKDGSSIFSASHLANGWGGDISPGTWSHTFSFNANCPSPTPSATPTIAPTINPTPEPTIPPTTGDCSAKSINDFNKNVDDTTDALNKLSYLFSLVSSSSTSGFKTKATYNSPMYDQGAYDFALDIQQRTAEVKAMENSAIEAQRIAYSEYYAEAAKIGVSAGLVMATAGMSAVPGFLTQLAATSPEVFFLAVESPQVLAALNRASTLITALKILNPNTSCLTPVLATGVNDSKIAIDKIDDFLNGIYKATGNNRGSLLKWNNLKSLPTWGHTFLHHGEGKKITSSLIDTARSTGVNQGQWLDNKVVSDFLEKLRPSLQVTSGSVKPVLLPSNVIGQVIKPDGTIVKATHYIAVPKSNGGYTTAYPTLGN